MNGWQKPWKAYSASLLVVWVVILALVWKFDSRSVLWAVLLIFYGFFVGWLLATVKLVLMNRTPAGKN